MELGLKDKVVVITAGTGGIGQALVKAFAAEGCKLAVTSTSQEKLDAFIPTVDIAPENIVTYVMDATKEDEVKFAIQSAAEHYGTIDSIVINQGWEGIAADITKADLDLHRKVYEINVFSVAACMKYAAPYMIEKKHGSIVIIASNGSYTGSATVSHYCGSKHGTFGLMKSVALELGPQGIHVNAICPGGVDTPMIHRLEDAFFPPEMSREDKVAALSAQYLDKRYCKPEEVADAALFLASDKSAHIMGTGLRMDGGLDALDA